MLFLALILTLPPPADLNGQCAWGPVQHQAGRVTIDGTVWRASGSIQADGSLQLIWEELNSGRTAIGSYAVDDADLVGKWGWLDECKLRADGSIEGTTQPETIRITKGERGPEL